MANIVCSLRRIAFFLLDYLQGGTVKKAYLRLKKLEKLDSNSKEVVNYQQSALKELLKHATETSEFYFALKKKKLEEFPVINKSIIRIQQNKFISKKYNKTDLLTMFTSGSTGTPFCCYQDKIKKKHVVAELIFYSEKAGYQLGKNLLYIRGFCEGNCRPKIKQWLHNQTLILISKLDDLSLENIIMEMSLNSESTVLGYASTYDSMKSYFERNGTSLVHKKNIKGMISNGEMLFDDTRESMEKAFNCKCYSRYSNQENGVIGQDDKENNTFLLNESHYFIEILKTDSDETAKIGEIGRIVLTDLYNYAMPMIRYDTGDLGSIKYLKQGDITKKTINNFGGRKEDIIFDCNGNLLSTSVIEFSFVKFPEIIQFQFIQVSPIKYRARVNILNKFENEEDLIQTLKGFLGQEAEIKVEYVNEIPILASGKRKMIINQMIK